MRTLRNWRSLPSSSRPTTLYRIGCWLIRQKTAKPETARRPKNDFENVVKLSPNDFRWWIELGRAYEQAENVQGRGKKPFVRAVNLAPNYTFPHWQLGNFLPAPESKRRSIRRAEKKPPKQTSFIVTRFFRLRGIILIKTLQSSNKLLPIRLR